MNPRSTLGLAALSLLSVNLTACEVVKGIFKAGVWVGVLGVLGVVVLVAFRDSVRAEEHLVHDVREAELVAVGDLD